MEFDEMMAKYITPYYEAQEAKKQSELDILANKHEKINSKLQVRKIYELDINGEWSDQVNEIVYNHFEECLNCKVENAKTNTFHDLRDFENIYIECLECNTNFKLVDGEWYSYWNPPKLIKVTKEEIEAYSQIVKEDLNDETNT